MKDGIKQLVGKRITGVVAARNDGAPRHQVFLLLEDGTRFEFHGDSFTCTSGLDGGPGVFRYIRDGGGKVTRAYGLDDAQVAEAIEAATEKPARGRATATLTRGGVESTQRLLARDLAAWKAAKAAVEKARKR